ncbi:MAG: alpha/beta hydrolase [Kiritimatiellae bacterium]|nr:alpha/beta hydrolase [Kiritimatiellia bacterium]
MTGSSKANPVPPCASLSSAPAADKGGGQARKSANLVDELGTHLTPTRMIVYRTHGDHALRFHVFEPEGWQPGDSRPCFLTIHGGGWAGGSVRRFYPFADHFAKLGMVAISMEYRLTAKGGITPFDCVRDGRSAVRYLRSHAKDLGIDPQRIVVSGGSAGAHVAAGTALFDGIDAEDEDTGIPAVPNVLVLYYPVIDTSPEGYGHAKCGPRWQDISPLHRIKSGMPPTLVFHGAGDTVTPFKGARLFHEGMLQAGNRCELIVHENGVHGYFLYDLSLFAEVMKRTASFLMSLGYL